MERMGRCPKCTSTDIYRSEYIHAGSPGWWLAIDAAHRDRKGVFEVYACRGGGFAEMYVRHLEDIPPTNAKPKRKRKDQ